MSHKRASAKAEHQKTFHVSFGELISRQQLWRAKFPTARVSAHFRARALLPPTPSAVVFHFPTRTPQKPGFGIGNRSSSQPDCAGIEIRAAKPAKLAGARESRFAAQLIIARHFPWGSALNGSRKHCPAFDCRSALSGGRAGSVSGRRRRSKRPTRVVILFARLIYPAAARTASCGALPEFRSEFPRAPSGSAEQAERSAPLRVGVHAKRARNPRRPLVCWRRLFRLADRVSFERLKRPGEARNSFARLSCSSRAPSAGCLLFVRAGQLERAGFLLQKACRVRLVAPPEKLFHSTELGSIFIRFGRMSLPMRAELESRLKRPRAGERKSQCDSRTSRASAESTSEFRAKRTPRFSRIFAAWLAFLCAPHRCMKGSFGRRRRSRSRRASADGSWKWSRIAAAARHEPLVCRRRPPSSPLSSFRREFSPTSRRAPGRARAHCHINELAARREFIGTRASETRDTCQALHVKAYLRFPKPQPQPPATAAAGPTN